MSALKDIKTVLRAAYVAKLAGVILSDTVVIKIFDRVPNPEEMPFIQIGRQTAEERFVKDSFLYDATIDLDITTGFPGNEGGKEVSDDIADQIIQLVRVRTADLLSLAPNFKMINAVLADDINFEIEGNDNLNVYRRVLTFSHIVQQV